MTGPELRVHRVRALLLASAVAAIASLGCLAPAPAAAVEATPPLIESIVPKGGIEQEIAVTINPEGLETTYLIAACMTEPASLECESRAPVQGVEGRLPAGLEGVRVDLNIEHILGGQYAAIVAAQNGAGLTSERVLFTDPIPLPAPEMHVTPYEDPHSSEGLEQGPRAAARAEVEFLAEKKATEEQEQLAAEAARRTATPPVTNVTAPVPHCVIPSLLGHTLSGARYLLEKAHCRLGHVYYPRSRRGSLRVARQNPARGVHLNSGALVAVRLARAGQPGGPPRG